MNKEIILSLASDIIQATLETADVTVRNMIQLESALQFNVPNKGKHILGVVIHMNDEYRLHKVSINYDQISNTFEIAEGAALTLLTVTEILDLIDKLFVPMLSMPYCLLSRLLSFSGNENRRVYRSDPDVELLLKLHDLGVDVDSILGHASLTALGKVVNHYESKIKSIIDSGGQNGLMV